MLTASAARSLPVATDDVDCTVVTQATLRGGGWSGHMVQAQLNARRWQRRGRAIVLHNGPLASAERDRVALLNCGNRAVLTAFSAAQSYGLEGWEREQTHVLVPGGARTRHVRDLAIRVHYASDWTAVDRVPARRLHALAPALILAAGTFDSPRAACGLVAAAVQQRLVSDAALTEALGSARRTKHRNALNQAVQDIAGGAEALSEIDFVRLCRRFALPMPEQQAVRLDASGRKRYLDATWRLPDGRLLVVEVDGALHLAPRRWYDDQLRQNELVLTGALVLRFPSVIVRTEAALVAAQLRRGLGT